ncbi:MAG: acyl-CoA thioesterase [Pseudomonadota bacterium]
MREKPRLSVTTTIEPQFYDVDPMNIVWHGNHVRFLEIARRDFLKKIDYDYEEMRKSGYQWPIVDLRLRYYRPIHFAQNVDIETSLIDWEARLKLAYLIIDQRSREKLVRAHSVQVAVDLNSKEMLWETPKAMREKLAPFLG